jgi:hypothetical protein
LLNPLHWERARSTLVMDRAEFFQMVTQGAYRPAIEANCVEKSSSLEASRGVDSYLSTAPSPMLYRAAVD